MICSSRGCSTPWESSTSWLNWRAHSASRSPTTTWFPKTSGPSPAWRASSRPSAPRSPRRTERGRNDFMDFLLHHMLRTSARRHPTKEALVHGRERLAYDEVVRRTQSLAAGLRRAGLRRGDRVGIYLEPSSAQVLSIFGTSQAGGVFVP